MSRRIALELPLVHHLARGDWPYRNVHDTDVEELAILLYASFRGTLENEGETFRDALAEIEKTFSGAYGRFLPECSVVIEEDEFLASACLISWFAIHQAPLVVFSMTRPDFQRRGMARFLLQTSINTLRDRGYRRLTLVVTERNKPALALYRALGFHRVSGVGDIP